MIEVADGLYVGSAEDYERVLVPLMEADTWATWSVLQAAKTPYHCQALNYPLGKAAPKDSPERFWARRGDRLILNMVDARDPDHIPKPMVDAAIDFLQEEHAKHKRVLIHCNQGKSRAPTLMLLLLAPILPESIEAAVAEFTVAYPEYHPAEGVYRFAERYWDHYRNRSFER